MKGKERTLKSTTTKNTAFVFTPPYTHKHKRIPLPFLSFPTALALKTSCRCSSAYTMSGLAGRAVVSTLLRISKPIRRKSV